MCFYGPAAPAADDEHGASPSGGGGGGFLAVAAHHRELEELQRGHEEVVAVMSESYQHQLRALSEHAAVADNTVRRLEGERLKVSDPAAAAVEAQTGAPIRGSITLADLLRRSGFHAADLVTHGLADAALPQEVREGAEIDIKYSGYLARQRQQIEQVRRAEHRPIPADVPWAAIGTLSAEARENGRERRLACEVVRRRQRRRVDAARAARD